jgi:DNA polymerase III alpha subunit (gram-positive type)
MRRFVAVDLETTGVDPVHDFIVEVGLAGQDYISGKYFETSFSLDFPPRAMTHGAAAVNGWGKRQFAPIVTYDWAAGYLTSQLNDVHIVGKNPWFDEQFLQTFLRENGLDQIPWHHRLVDVGCLAWGSYQRDTMFGTDESKARVDLPPNVEEVERMLGIPRETVDGFHTALLDARWAYEAFRNIVPEVVEV